MTSRCSLPLAVTSVVSNICLFQIFCFLIVVLSFLIRLILLSLHNKIICISLAGELLVTLEGSLLKRNKKHVLVQ